MVKKCCTAGVISQEKLKLQVNTVKNEDMMRRCFWACCLLVLGCIVLENYLAFDEGVQRFFYTQGAWLISQTEHARLKGLWYTGPKVLLAVVGGSCLMAALLALKLPGLKLSLGRWLPFLWLLGLSIACIPLILASAKAVSGVRSPNELIPFGGNHAHIGMLARLLDYGTVDGGRSFPAGHAAGGFSLMALYYWPLGRRMRLGGLALGLAAGWGMGLYQMARGEHFLTHTLTTMFAAWAGILLLRRFCRRFVPGGREAL